MIVDLKKYLIIGMDEDIDRFFIQAQNQGFLEFITLSGKKSIEHSEEIQHILAALKILHKLPEIKPYVGGGEVSDALEISKKIVFLHKKIEDLETERRLLRAEIIRVSPFGDFSRDDVEFIETHGKRKIQFFCMKSEKAHKAHLSDDVIYVGTEYDLDYFITINPNLKPQPNMIEMRIDRPLGELKRQLAEAIEALHTIEKELKSFAGHSGFLHHILIDLMNDHNLASAKSEIVYPLNNSLFAIEAWVPENRVGTLFALVSTMSIHCEEILVEETDKVPTCMENVGSGKMGEDLVKIYDIPAVTDKDPSRWVFWAFILFFAMIVADAGYGLLYLGTAVYLKWKFPTLAGSKKRLLRLFFILSLSCIAWGVLTSGYFGLRVDAQSFLGKISLLKYFAAKKAHFTMGPEGDGLPITQSFQNMSGKGDITLSNEMIDEYSRDVLLEFSLMVGVIHVSISLLRYIKRSWSGLGWIAFMIGGYLYFPTMLHATSLINVLGWITPDMGKQVGLQLIYGGIGSAILLALIQKRAKGIGEIANVVQVFADVLSYLRLYALGLAGAIMAETFNGIGTYIGLVAGIFATIVGHVVNIQLGVMAGVIHGLRLNFLEWYHYSFDGNGRLFKPLKKLKVKE